MPPPKGTAHKQKKPRPRFSAANIAPLREPLTTKELQGFENTLRDTWGWSTVPREGQTEAIKAQLKGLDVEVHAYTGWGKTCIAAGPHVHPSSKGRVSIMVSPLITLQDEQVKAFQTDYKISAVAVNSSHGGCSDEVLKDIIAGKYQIVLISPELLQTRKFTNEVLRNPSFTRRILSVIVDEAHVVSHWGAQFRKKYSTLGIIRSFLPRGASVVAMSATLGARVRADVREKLQFHKMNYVSIDVGNDRSNVSLIVRAIEHPLNTYIDLDFVIPPTVEKPEDIPLTWIYADNIGVGVEIEDHLVELLPAHLRGSGIIRPFNAAYSQEYRNEAMRLVREGTIRILICTDAAGMGCNIPNIERVVQWKLPSSVSAFVQRAGRAARGPGTKGVGILLVEKSVYSEDLAAVKEPSETAGKKKTKGKKKKEPTSATARRGAQLRAAARGVKRGCHAGGINDAILVKEQPKLDPNTTDEGLKVLVQTGLCRRRVLKEVFNNKNINPIVPCCDLCCPELLNTVRPGYYKAPSRRNGLIAVSEIVGINCLFEIARGF